MSSVQYIQVESEESGQKLFHFIQRRVQGNVPKSAVMRWIRKGEVRVDYKKSKPFFRVSQGQIIRIPPYYSENQNTLFSAFQKNPFLLRKVHEDEQILVLAKPPDLATQPGSKVKDSVYDQVQRHYHDAVWKPQLVHRLDKSTSGLLVLAKSYEYLHYLQNKWKANKISKIYLTWIENGPDWKEWTRIEDRLSSNKSGSVKNLKTVSECKTLIRGSGKTLLAIRLHTGRKHQIRRQLYLRGLPIIGDRKFQGTGCRQGLLLHACILGWDNHLFSLAPQWKDEFRVPEEVFSSLVQEVASLSKFNQI